MILYKTIKAEDILNLLASTINEKLPQQVKDATTLLHFEFTDDHSVEVFLISKDEEQAVN